MMDQQTIITFGVIGTFLTTVAGFIYTWFREGRARAWQQADAKALAEKAQVDAKALADKVANDAKEMAQQLKADTLALAADNLNKAAVVADKLISDAEKIAAKVHESAEKLANKVTENTVISTDAARGASDAFKEANTVNQKIKDLQEQVVKIGDHVLKQAQAAAVAEKAAHEEVVFNQRVKAAIEEKLKELNGRAERFRSTKKKAGR